MGGGGPARGSDLGRDELWTLEVQWVRRVSAPSSVVISVGLTIKVGPQQEEAGVGVEVVRVAGDGHRYTLWGHRLLPWQTLSCCPMRFSPGCVVTWSRRPFMESGRGKACGEGEMFSQNYSCFKPNSPNAFAFYTF